MKASQLHVCGGQRISLRFLSSRRRHEVKSDLRFVLLSRRRCTSFFLAHSLSSFPLPAMWERDLCVSSTVKKNFSLSPLNFFSFCSLHEVGGGGREEQRKKKDTFLFDASTFSPFSLSRLPGEVSHGTKMHVLLTQPTMDP